LPFLLVEVAHDPLDKMKKTELAERAERVTAGTNWLPALVRVDGLCDFGS
jgi:hypothetical protein